MSAEQPPLQSDGVTLLSVSPAIIIVAPKVVDPSRYLCFLLISQCFVLVSRRDRGRARSAERPRLEARRPWQLWRQRKPSSKAPLGVKRRIESHTYTERAAEGKPPGFRNLVLTEPHLHVELFFSPGPGGSFMRKYSDTRCCFSSTYLGRQEQNALMRFCCGDREALFS